MDVILISQIIQIIYINVDVVNGSTGFYQKLILKYLIITVG